METFVGLVLATLGVALSIKWIFEHFADVWSESNDHTEGVN